MNTQNLAIIDFETAGNIVHKGGVLDASVVHPIQVACVVMDPRRLQVIPGSEFNMMMRPPAGTKLNPKALEVNKKKPEEVWAAPDTPTVWNRFAEHMRRFNPKGTSPFTAPIACGKNIRNFDMPIVQWLCQQHGQVDKGGQQNLFSQRVTVDLEDYLLHWFENSDDLPNMKMDTVREYMGVSGENGHDALQDCLDTALIIRKFQLMYRGLFPKVKFRGCCAAS